MAARDHGRSGRGRDRLRSASRTLTGTAACLLLQLCAVLAQPADGAESTTAPSDQGDAGAPEDAMRAPSFHVPMRKPPASADLPPPNVFAALSVMRGAGFNPGRGWRAGRNEYRAIVERESLASGLPPALLDAVMAVESRYNPDVVGMDGEIGLMQVMPATARMLGFTGTPAQLADPELNIHYGAKYLAGAWRLASQDLCTATMKYRAGHGETRFSFRSVDYCLKVRSHLAAQGVPVGGAVPQPTFGARAAAPSRGAASGRSGSVDFAVLNAKLRELTARISGSTAR